MAVPGPGDRDRARALADRAEQIARPITDPAKRRHPGQGSQVVDSAGDRDHAQQSPGPSPTRTSTAGTVAAVAKAAARARLRPRQADRPVHRRPDKHPRAVARVAAAGRRLTTAPAGRPVYHRPVHAPILAKVAVAVARVGDHDRAERSPVDHRP